MGVLDELRVSIGGGMGFDKKEPIGAEEQERLVDEAINAMSNTELIWHLDLIEEVKAGKYS